MSAKRSIAICALFSALMILISCSSGPEPPRMGSPAYFWGAAKEVYTQGDYMKAIEHLDNLLATENDFTARALPWALVLKSGLAAGYMDIAANFDMGSHLNRSDPTSFRRQVNENRQSAARLALAFAEDFGKLDHLKGDTIALAFGYPKGTAAPVPQFTKVSQGQVIAPAEIETAGQTARQRGVLLAACRAAGAADDTAKASEILKSADTTVPRATFLMAMAETLYNDSQLFTSDKLDDPRKMQIFTDLAQNALKAVPESKDTKELDKKIQAALKKGKK